MYKNDPERNSGPASSGTPKLAQIEPPSTLVLLISGEKCFAPHLATFKRLTQASSAAQLHADGGMVGIGATDIQFARLQRERLACGHATH